jgi:hypothetical protein
MVGSDMSEMMPPEHVEIQINGSHIHVDNDGANYESEVSRLNGQWHQDFVELLLARDTRVCWRLSGLEEEEEEENEDEDEYDWSRVVWLRYYAYKRYIYLCSSAYEGFVWKLIKKRRVCMKIYQNFGCFVHSQTCTSACGHNSPFIWEFSMCNKLLNHFYVKCQNLLSYWFFFFFFLVFHVWLNYEH